MTDVAKLTKAIDMNCEYLGIPRLLLMENAGREIARHSEKFKKIAVFSGTGNNGGDGFVAARHLSGTGKIVKVYAVDGKRTIEAQKNFEMLQNLDSVEIELIKDFSDSEKIKKEIKGFDLIIDALIGVGLKGGLREPIKSLIRLINSAKAFKISVDIPSGSVKESVKADLTVSFHIPKTKNAKVVSIGIPKEAEFLCGPGDVYLSIPKRLGSEHKGDFGRILVIGGSRNFIGTPMLVASAALRTGADIAIICCPSYVAEKMPFNPNLIINPMKSEFYFSEDDVDDILKINFDSVVIGNGLGTNDETGGAVRKFLKRVDKPVVIDADALKLVDGKNLKKNFILTPHEMEFKILCGGEAEPLRHMSESRRLSATFKKQEEDFNPKFNSRAKLSKLRQRSCRIKEFRSFDFPKENRIDKRIKMVENFARTTKTTIVLKGPVDIISDGERTKLNRTGNPGMTVGGTGDVLAGIIGALLPVAEDKFEAACAGAFLSGLSGDLACQDFGYSLIATDVIEKIPEAIKFCGEFE